MGFRFIDWLVGKPKATSTAEIHSIEFREALQEYHIRELAFHTCVCMIANAVGKCEFKTYKNGAEHQGKEYYLWNIEPNPNQNSTAFLHKLIYQLYAKNEALIISSVAGGGRESLAVADYFDQPVEYPWKLQEYKGVVIGEVSYHKTFTEKEVMHLKLNHCDIKPVIDALHQSYVKMVSCAMKNYIWAGGKHYKVHVGQVAQRGQVGAEGKDWNEAFTGMLNKQVKPFLTSENGVLPEFDGYEYQDIGGSPDTQRSTRDIRALIDDIFEFTARAFLIPPVLIFGGVADSKDAMARWMTTCIDPLCNQLEEEGIRKRYGYEEWKNGDYMHIDTSAIMHFDLFGNAPNIEKLIGSGAFSVNAVLKAAGQTAIDEPWADQHFVTKNFETINNAMNRMEGEGGEEE